MAPMSNNNLEKEIAYKAYSKPFQGFLKGRTKTGIIAEKLGEIFEILYQLVTKILAILSILFHECLAWTRETVKVDSNKVNNLEGKVVLITGANSGIGECLSKYFFQAGCKLILAARRRNELERVKDELLQLERNGGAIYTPVVLELDLSDIKSIPQKAEEAIKAHGGRIDILVNNAGIFNQGQALDTLVEVDQRVMTVNYFGPLALTKEIARHMLSQESKGQIVFVSSVLGKMTITNSLSYSASKHALQALADSLRAENPELAITIASPSYVKTDITKNALTSTGQKLGVVTNEIETGFSPDFVCERIFKAVVNKEADIMIAPFIHRGAIYLRNFFPMLFFVLIRIYGRRFKY